MGVADILLNRVNGKTILYRKLGRGDPVKLSGSMRSTGRELPEAGPLLAIDLVQNNWNGIRVGTVHPVKGEGIPAVMYLRLKKNLDALVAGTVGEEGRIGYVAATRARDLFVVAIPQATSINTVTKLKALGFSEWELK